MNLWAAHVEQLIEVGQSAVVGGVSVIEVREKGVVGEDLGFTAAELRQSAPETLLVLNADYGDMRYVVEQQEMFFDGLRGPDGIHLAEQASKTTREAKREMAGLTLLKSVHSLDAALQAERDGADMLVLGTVFPSQSHPSGPTIGLEGVREVCDSVKIPVIGIGGITAANAGDVIRAGASGVAVISAIFDAPDPRAAAAELRAEIDAAWAERGQS
jgi:thiamine-phosphate diphosphorylase